MPKQFLILQIFVLNFIPNVFTNPINHLDNNMVRQNNNTTNTQHYNNKQILNDKPVLNNNKQEYNTVQNKINHQAIPKSNRINSDTVGRQMILNKNNNKQVYSYDKTTGTYTLLNPNQNNTVVQKESIYEIDPATGRYRLTKKAKQQILNKYNARTGTQQLNDQLKLIIDSVLNCNDINTLNTIIINWNNTIVNNITQNKLSKQYVKGIWEAWYNQNSKLLSNKLLQLCNNNIDMYKQISKTNIFSLDIAMKFIDAI